MILLFFILVATVVASENVKTGVADGLSKLGDTWEFQLLNLSTPEPGDVYDKAVYTVPITNVGVWEQISPRQMSCPPDLTSTKFVGPAVEGILFHGFNQKDSYVKGYKCIGLDLISTCVWGLIQNDYKQSTDSHMPNIASCAAQRELLKTSLTFVATDLQFPEPQCTMFSTKSVKKSVLYVEPSDLPYDPYSDAVVSTIFNDQKCTANECALHDVNGWWIRESVRSQCGENRTVEMRTGRKGRRIGVKMDDGREFWSDDAVCKVDVCGVRGVVMSHGRWVGFKTESDIPPIKTCDRSVKVSMIPETSRGSSLIEELVISSRRTTCQTVLNTIIETNKITPWQLSMFRPIVPCEWYVYRLRYGVIERTMAHYIGLKSLSIPKYSGGSSYHIGVTADGKQRVMWLPDGSLQTSHRLVKEHVSTGPNGWTLSKTGDLIVPDIEMTKTLTDVEINIAHEVADSILPHHEMIGRKLRDRTRFKSETVITHRLPTDGAQEALSNAWDQYQHYLWITSAVVISVLLCACGCWLWSATGYLNPCAPIWRGVRHCCPRIRRPRVRLPQQQNIELNLL